MSMQAALGIAGGVIGAFFGMPQLGFLIGGVIGSLLTPAQKTQGPRLDDLKVQVSTYGNGIPTVYGTMRVGGNVIWSTDKLEIPTYQTAGKGGGASNTSYKYYVHMAIALCNGPATAIRKIWQDGRLVYDASTGAVLASALATAANPFTSVTFFPGDESQLPDPIIEGFEGVGNVPAYRAIAYVRLLAVECPGGRVPQFSFEITTNAVTADQIYNGTPYTIPSQWTAGSRMGPNAVLFSNDASVGVFAIGLNYGTRTATIGKSATLQALQTPQGDADIDAICLRQNAGGGGDTGNNYFIDATGATVKVITVGTDCVITGGAYSSWSKRGDNLMVAASNPTDRVKLFSWSTGLQIAYADIPSQKKVVCTDSYGWIFDGTNLQVRSMDASFTQLAIAAVPYKPASIPLLCYGPSDKPYFIWNKNNDTYIYTASYSGGAITFTLVHEITRADNSIPYPMQYPVSVQGTNIYCYTTAVTGGAGATTVVSPAMIAMQQYSAQPVAVSSIITDQCTKAGLSAGQIDVSTLQDTAWGYIAANVASARNNLQPLLTACAIDAVDEDGKVRFFKRSAIVSRGTVTYNELAVVDGSGTPGDPMPLTRTQEAELPSSVAVNYISPAYDYQTVAETARRSTDLTRNDQTVDLPMGCSADFAASVAQMLLYDAWNERNRRTTQVSRKFAAYSAGDGVTIEYPQGTFQLWMLAKVVDTGVLMQWELVPADATIYTLQAIGSPQPPAQQVLAFPTPTQFTIIDGPILQDADNNAGVYVAMTGSSTPYPGGELFIGPDASSLVSRGAVQNEAPQGIAENVPSAWGSTSVDETNVINVNFGRFTLSSCTRDVLLAGTTNVAAYGANGRWEYVAFRSAVSLGSGRYALSGLLRGQRGTEWASGLHQANDAFVMLGLAGTLRPVLDVGAIGTNRLYRAYTEGGGAATDQVYATTGEPLKPLSPVNVRRSFDTSNNATLTWDRRTRLSQNWLMGIVPLGETSESYSVDIYSSSAFTTIVGTFAATSPSLALTAAQQTAMGLTPGAAINVAVYQVSSSIGRGRAAQATV
jgi:hypothetical protein